MSFAQSTKGTITIHNPQPPRARENKVQSSSKGCSTAQQSHSVWERSVMQRSITRTVSISEAVKLGRPIRSTAATNRPTSLSAAAEEAPPCSSSSSNDHDRANRNTGTEAPRGAGHVYLRWPTSLSGEAGQPSLRSAAQSSAPSASAALRSSSDACGCGSGSPEPRSSARSHPTASDRRRRSAEV